LANEARLQSSPVQFSEPSAQGRVAVGRVLPLHAQRQGLLRAHDHDQPLAASDGRVQQVPLEQQVVLGVQRDRDAGIRVVQLPRYRVRRSGVATLTEASTA